MTRSPAKPFDSRGHAAYAEFNRGPMPTFTFTYTYAYRFFSGGGGEWVQDPGRLK